MLLPGTIFEVKGSGIWPLSWVYALVEPPGRGSHYGMILLWYKGDYIILESIGKGIAIGRLSFYAARDLRFYWPAGATPGDGKRAAWNLTAYGRLPFDYFLIAKLVIQGVFLLLKHPWRKIKVKELSWVANSAFICTEAAYQPWAEIGFDFTEGNAPIPSAFRKAVLEGRLTEITSDFWRTRE